MSKIRYTVYVSACVSDHACACVGPATHACFKLYIWDLSLGIETLEEVRRTGRVVRKLTLSTLRIRTMGGSVRSLYRLSQRRLMRSV